MKRSLWITALLFALGFAGAAATRTDNIQGIAGRMGLEHGQHHKQVDKNTRAVLVTTVRADRSESEFSLPGVIAAGTEETRAFQVGGRLLERRVSLGDHVKQGDVLARLDTSDLRLAVEATRAERFAAITAFEKAKAHLSRVTSLQTDGWASNRTSDEALVSFEEARGRLERAQRAVMLTRNNLDYATIRADSDGLVTREFAEAGQIITPGQPIVRIAHDEGREAIVAVPESALADIRYRRAIVELWSDADATFRAELVELSPIADPVTRTFEARFRIEEGKGPALGMSATVRLSKPDSRESTEVPLSALQFSADGASVWTVDTNGLLERRPVTVASMGADKVKISSGIREGEQVVVIGTHKLLADETVRTIQYEG